MKNTNLIQLLKCFSKEEVREFGKFVKSPFFNNRKDVSKYYDILKKYHPGFNDDIISNEKIFKELYPGIKYDANDIVRLNSYLFNLGKDFLVISGVRDDEYTYKYMLLTSLDAHRADNLFEKEFQKTDDFLSGEMLHNDFFLKKSQIETLKTNFYLIRNNQKAICENVINKSVYNIYNFIIGLSVSFHDMFANKYTYNFDYTDTTPGLFIKNLKL